MSGGQVAPAVNSVARTYQRIEANMKSTLSAIPAGRELWSRLPAQHQFPHLNTVAARERIAKALVEAERWIE